MYLMTPCFCVACCFLPTFTLTYHASSLRLYLIYWLDTTAPLQPMGRRGPVCMTCASKCAHETQR